jgi:hypothetical protein
VRKLLAALSGVLIVVVAPPLGFGWGREGHEVVALMAEQNMTNAALERAKAILGGASLEEVASCADEYRRNHRETGLWHYINIPLTDSKIDMARECPNAQCVIAQTEHFLPVLKDSKADPATKA